MRIHQQKQPSYLDGILHKHADQAVDVLLPRNFEVRVNLINQGFHAEDEEWERCLENLVHFLDVIPGTTERDCHSGSF